ncbi:hypothetical protein EI94DRAFT_1802248 [Lactarius quietus]|nr:hypothetical protein EI94DRAFT_1802248 [Lactarius quietus]
MDAKVDNIDRAADPKALGERPREGRTEDSQWRARLSGGKVSTLADLQQAVRELASDTAHVATQKDTFAIAVPKFRETLVRMIRISADAAISSVVRFGDALLTPHIGRKTIARTRGLALRVQHEFRTVHEYVHDALALAADLIAEITYWRTRAEDCTRGLSECRTIASTFANGAETRFGQAQGLIAAAQRELTRAQETFHSAQRLHPSPIRNAEQEMHAAQENLTALEAQRDAARAELDAWNAEQRKIEDVFTQLRALNPALSLAERTVDEHRTRLTDGANGALDVEKFFGGLVARTAEWSTITSASALAEAVVKLQQLLETNTRLTGVFLMSPAVLDDELKRLSDSNVPPDLLSTLM